MARYKEHDYDQMKMIPVSFDRQILPGSFEYSLAYLIDHELDLSAFDAHYNNDTNGCPAYDSRLLLKIIILAYSKGITSSRQIERLCRENITFMAISADTQPHFSTLADFISRSPESITDLFSQVVLMCDQLGLIGKEMFAIDGCKLPSNASKEWSGTHAELNKKRRTIDSPKERHIYSQRLGTVEPVFGHITDAIGIKRFSLRGKRKVDGQWKLMMMLHNILKIHRYGWKWA